jgi:hypothetical protein
MGMSAGAIVTQMHENSHRTDQQLNYYSIKKKTVKELKMSLHLIGSTLFRSFSVDKKQNPSINIKYNNNFCEELIITWTT